MKHLWDKLGSSGRQAVDLVGVNGVFWFAWAFGCYQTVYLQSVGFSASQLGLLNAISSGVGIAAVAFWGMVSDKIGSLRKVLIITLVVGASLYALVPQIPTYTPWLLTAFIPALNFFRTPQTTFAENILVRNCNELDLNFGMLRSISSLLFTVGSLIIASVLPMLGIQSTFRLSGLLMLPVIAFTFFAREPNAKTATGGPGEKKDLNVGQLFRIKPYVMLLVFAFIYYIAGTCEGNFIPYFMRDVGVPTEKYGIITAYRALLEIPLLLFVMRLRRRFPLRNMVAAAALLMAVECLGFGLFAKTLAGMLLFSTFFGLGSGLFIGSCLNYVYELAPDDLKATAQAFYASVSSVAGILGNLLGGLVCDAVGAKPFYLAVGGVYLLSVLIFVLSFSRRKKAAA